MPLTARQLRQPLTIEAIGRVLYFADIFHYSLENSQVLDLGIAFSTASLIQLVRSITRLSASVLILLSLSLYASSREAKGPFSPISI